MTVKASGINKEQLSNAKKNDILVPGLISIDDWLDILAQIGAKLPG